MSEKALDEVLAVLPTLDRPTLLHKFEKLYGRAPPLRFSRRLILLAIAYRLQEQAYGGLGPAVRRRLMSPASAGLPKARTGTVMIREWQGQHHTVMVTDKGVEYRGEVFASLTAVARRITSQKRSGPAFFGVQGNGRG